MQRIKITPLHPFLFSVYPVLALLGHNIDEIRAIVALRALLLVLSFSILTLIVFRMLLKNWHQAAIMTTAVTVAFFAYGHVYNYFKDLDLTAATLGRHRILAPLWLAGFAIFFFWLARTRRDLSGVHAYLNLAAAVVLITPLFQLASFGIRSQAVRSAQGLPEQMTSDLRLPLDTPPPDIYYFILDAYSRDDTLLTEYGLDNTPFLKQLQELGFFVAYCSQSNYAQTQLSLASSLNFSYLDSLDPRFTAGNTDRSALPEFIKHSAVREAFESLGYQIVAFETGFKTTEWEDADLYLSPSAAAVGSLQTGAGLNDFELMLINTSAGRLLTDAAIKLPQFLQDDFDNPRRIHRERIEFALDQLMELPALPGPKFVFAHLVVPHPPYVFGPDGEFTDFDQDKILAYRNQVIYLNKLLIPLLSTLQQDSATPPIIVIQGDHGGVESDQSFRMDILNAYYLPGDGASQLDENISPVNSFRIIFNQYFGGQYALLEDTSYFSSYGAPFDYSVIKNRRPGCR